MTHSSSLFVSGGASTNTVIGSSGGYGVQNWPEMLVDIVPLAKNAANVAASQTLAGAGNLTLTAGTGVTAAVDAYGNNRYTFDVPRCVTITSGGVDTGITFLVKGYDAFNVPVSQLITGGSTATVTSKKAFASVVSITASGATASTVTAGTADVFGMPVQVIDKTYVGTLNWSNTVAIDSGTFTVADQTSPATNLTGDVRGTYAPSSGSTGSARLIVKIVLNKNQCTGSANATAVLGVTQA